MHHYRSDSVEEAVLLAEQLRQAGDYQWFRGQAECWPLKASLLRCTNSDRKAAQALLARFAAWVEKTTGVRELLRSDDEILAVAQHYGLPTTFVDFTVEPSVAGFFASHAQSRPPRDTESCIFCINTSSLEFRLAELRDLKIPPPRIVECDVPDLWRLHAQSGVFLDLPWEGQIIDAELLDEILPMAVILFPNKRLVSSPQPDEIYPPRKSGLEVLLDQFFANESLIDANFKTHALLGHRHLMRAWDWKFDSTKFINATLPPALPSWQKHRETWLVLPKENWSDVRSTSCLVVSAPTGEPIEVAKHCTLQVQEFLKAHPDARRKLVSIDAIGQDGYPLLGYFLEEGDEDHKRGSITVSRILSSCWDGMRRLPFTDMQIARALGQLTALHACRVSNNTAENIDAIFGLSLSIEFGSFDGSYRRAYVPIKMLAECVRSDMAVYLVPDVKEQTLNDIRLLINAIVVPERTYDFVRLTDLFAHYIIPSQLFMCPNSITYYSPMRLDYIGSATFHIIKAFVFRDAFYNLSNYIVLDHSIDLNLLQYFQTLLHLRLGRGESDVPTLHIKGFDDDPRELCEIAEVQEFCKTLVELGFISVLHPMTFNEPKESLRSKGLGAFEVWLIANSGESSRFAIAEINRDLMQLFSEELGQANSRCLATVTDFGSKRRYIAPLYSYYVSEV